MIIQEHFELNGIDFIRTFSDRGVMIRGGEPETDYSEATDPAELGRTYTETEIPIEGDSTAEGIVNILLGGEQE